MKRVITALVLSLTLMGSLPFHKPAEAVIQRTYKQISFVDDFAAEYEYPQISFLDTSRSSSTHNYYNPCINGLSDPLCDPRSSRLLVKNVLTTCPKTDFGPCIESIAARQQNGEWITGEYLGSRTAPRNSFDGNELFQFDDANESNLFEFPGISHVDGTAFEVIPYMQQKIEYGSSRGLESLSIKVRGVVRDSTVVPGRTCLKTPNCSGADSILEELTCIGSSVFPISDCWKIARVPNDIEFRLSLKLGQQPKGWITGRLFNPAIQVDPVIGSASLGYRITISGNPTSTPVLSRRYFSDNPSERQDWEKLALLPTFKRFGNWDDKNNEIQLLYSSQSFGTLKSLTNLDNSFDRATSSLDVWSVSLTWLNRWEESRCGLDELIGFVGSNALSFESAIPVFDEKTGVLSYQVESPHLDADGRTYEGTYSLILSRNYANCLWRLSAPNVVGQIEVRDQDGKKKSAISKISIDSKQVRFVASGYSYSAPSILVSIFEAKSNSTLTRKVIYCAKNSQVRKIVGKNPKCPKGFRRL